MSRVHTPLLAACGLSALAPISVSAHHSRALYDLNAEIVLEGTVVELGWSNPHIYFTVETTGPDGLACSRSRRCR